MSDLIRDSPLGQLIRYATKNKALQYPEEKADWQCPDSYKSAHSDLTPSDIAEKQLEADASKPVPGIEDQLEATEKTQTKDAIAEAPAEASTASSLSSSSSSLAGDADLTHARTKPDLEKTSTTRSQLSKITSRPQMEKITTRADLEQAYSNAIEARKVKSTPIVPEKLDDGTILVDWYSTDDPDNPQNWSLRKKIFVTFTIDLYTFAVYIGSAIYTPSIPGVIEKFGVSETAASLGLALYVLAYGIGPLIFSPLSEIPSIGRNPPYIITFAIFVILCVPTALVDNFAGLLVLRFLQGFFGSPCLATAGASLGDLYSLIKLPYAIVFWAAAATCGPALGPIVSGFSVPNTNWRWSLWEMLWLSGPVWILLFIALPETSGGNILLRRAKRLRKLTGNENMKSQSEIDQKNLNRKAILAEALWRPAQMTVLDPAILFVTIYTALIYGIFYSFFECFPLIYPVMYNFTTGELGLSFLSISVAIAIAIPIYAGYIYKVVEPDIMTNGLGAPERRLIPGLIACVLLPAGLFMFAWTVNPSIHWIVSMIGLVIFGIGIFIVLQVIFIYLPLTYPTYAASLFAANDFARSSLAAGAILFSRPMFVNLGVSKGISLLAGLTVGGIFGIWGLYLFGANLRARSKFAVK